MLFAKVDMRPLAAHCCPTLACFYVCYVVFYGCAPLSGLTLACGVVGLPYVVAIFGQKTLDSQTRQVPLQWPCLS